MSRSVLAATILTLGALLSACERTPARIADSATPGRAQSPFDSARLEAAIDRRFGGVGTCVIIQDTASGRELYQYGSHTLCRRPLPPCSTFKIPNSLIALDAGVITPQTVMKWDRSPQQVSAWERDADLAAAFKESMVWWFQRVARQVGGKAYVGQLDALDYGNERPEGVVDRFWMGPRHGGGLTISTREQADFLHRFYAGRLPVKAESAAAVRQIMINETRGAAVMSGKTGTCPSDPGGSRQVGWWAGRLQSGPRDYIFAASMEGPNDNALPGRELQVRVKAAFAEAGLWPSG